MQRRRLITEKPALVIFLFPFLIVFVFGQSTGEENGADSDPMTGLLIERYQQFLNAAGADTDIPEIAYCASHVQAVGKEWVYLVDRSGNQIFRPRSMAVHMGPLVKRAGIAADQVRQVPEQLVEKLKERTISHFREFMNDDLAWHVNTAIKREVLLKSRCGEAVSFTKGRYWVRLSSWDNVRYFQILYGLYGTPLRIETNFLIPSAIRLRDMVIAKLPSYQPVSEGPTSICLGTFYEPHERRFEVNCSTYESVDYLDPTAQTNPFPRGEGPFPTADSFLRSDEYRFWAWIWWDLAGRVNSAQGNWNPDRPGWQYPSVQLRQRRCLQDYKIEGGEPDKTVEFTNPDGSRVTYRQGVSLLMEDRFYEDLETCHMAVICSHGGALEERYQLLRNPDLWFQLGRADHKLGRRHLRHLFFHACSSMTCFKESRGQLLIREWMPAVYIEGLRTVCGSDGDHVALDRNGWRFWGRHHKGDSISDAWALGIVDEHAPNSPVTVAYGETPEAAIECLFDGRLSDQKAIPNYSVASLWLNLEEQEKEARSLF